MRWYRICGLTLLFLLLTSHSIHAYERDVHYDLTKYLALWAGFTPSEAEQVARANQELDEKAEFNPLPNPNFCPKLSQLAVAAPTPAVILATCKDDPEFQRMLTAQRAYHFADGTRLHELRESAFRGTNLKILGHYLHTLQDTFSHSIMDYSNLPPLDKLIAGLGFRPDEQVIGHLLYGHSVDKTHERPDLAELMARYAYMELRRFRDATDQWSKIRPSVAKFVREQDLEKKLAHLDLATSPEPKGTSPAVQESAELVFNVSTCTPQETYTVKGIIPSSVDLANDEVAKAYIQKAKDYAFQHCPELQALKPTQRFNGMGIALYHGDDRLAPVPDVRGDYCGFYDAACHGWKAITLERAVKEGIKNYKNVVRRRQEINASWKAWKAENGNLVRAAESQAGAAATYRLIREVGNIPICAKYHVFLEIAVDVPSEVDLVNDRLAEAYMGLALENAFRWCDGDDRDIWHYPQGRPWSVRVSLNQNGKRKVAGEIKKDASSGTYSDKRWNQFLTSWTNYVPEQRKAAEEARRRAEQREVAQRPIKERFDAFFRNHRADEAVSCESLSRNPFAMEGKTVVMRLEFEQMMAKDQGVLRWGGQCAVLVSGIPHGTFSTQRVEVLFAGKVLGNAKVSLGPVTLQVPHLRFGGLYVCKAENCADIIPNR